MKDVNRTVDGPDKNRYCGEPDPDHEGLFCVKTPGHFIPGVKGTEHTTLLGIHPEHEDGHGVMWPTQEEWHEWA